MAVNEYESCIKARPFHSLLLFQAVVRVAAVHVAAVHVAVHVASSPSLSCMF